MKLKIGLGTRNGMGLSATALNSGASAGLGPELVTDGDMELVGVANWADYATPLTKEKSSVQVHSGTQSLHLIADANFEGARQTTISVVAGVTYKIVVWTYVISGSAPRARVTIGSGTTDLTSSTTNVWEFLTADVLSDATGLETLQLDARSGESYWDDISIRAYL